MQFLFLLQIPHLAGLFIQGRAAECETVVPSWGWIGPLRDIGRCLETFFIVTAERCCWHQWVETRDLLNILEYTRQLPTTCREKQPPRLSAVSAHGSQAWLQRGGAELQPHPSGVSPANRPLPAALALPALPRCGKLSWKKGATRKVWTWRVGSMWSCGPGPQPLLENLPWSITNQMMRKIEGLTTEFVKPGVPQFNKCRLDFSFKSPYITQTGKAWAQWQ